MLLLQVHPELKFYRFRIIISLSFSGVTEAIGLYKELFEPRTLTMRVELDNTKIPENIIIETAMKLIKMEEDGGRNMAAASA